MFRIKLEATESQPAVELRLEHSLVSLSKWEQKHEKVFFSKAERTTEESVSYIECMVIDENPPEDFLSRLTLEHVEAIFNYINSKQTATTFSVDQSKKKNKEVITSELVYYWLIQFQIPFTCETWNFNRLMTLIQICGIKQTKPKKMSKDEWAKQQRQLNAERRAALNSNG